MPLFFSRVTTEFLIFRIGHTKCTGKVAEALEDSGKDEGNKSDLIHTGATGNLADLEVRDLRGKLVLVFDKEFNSNFESEKRNRVLPVLQVSVNRPTGLTFCGRYSGGLGTRSLPRQEQGELVGGGRGRFARGVRGAQEPSGSHLLWVYWQETGGDVLKNTTAAQGMHTRLDEFLFDIRDPKKSFLSRTSSDMTLSARPRAAKSRK